MKHEIWELQSMQAAPLSTKVALTKQRIREWVDEYGEDGVYVSFSGGKDSTVLLHIAREIYPDIKAVFSDTGLEFPETREFVKQFDNVDWVKPKMSFVEVIKKYGYPMISKEVSECVWGARKYLTQVIESESALNERTNERTKWHAQKFRQLCGSGEHSRLSHEPLCRNFTEDFIWKSIQMADGKSAKSALGVRHAPWRFGAVTGVLTTQNTIDARLYKNYRQFASAASDGNKQPTGKSDDGDYP